MAFRTRNVIGTFEKRAPDPQRPKEIVVENDTKDERSLVRLPHRDRLFTEDTGNEVC